jgi:transposase-like protein
MTTRRKYSKEFKQEAVRSAIRSKLNVIAANATTGEEIWRVAVQQSTRSFLFLASQWFEEEKKHEPATRSCTVHQRDGHPSASNTATGSR